MSRRGRQPADRSDVPPGMTKTSASSAAAVARSPIRDGEQRTATRVSSEWMPARVSNTAVS